VSADLERDGRRLTDAVLRERGMAEPEADADKEGRGNVLVIAGSREVPGAALLTATAALRVGAGRLTIATPASVAMAIAIAMPEARVIALAERPSGGLGAEAATSLEPLVSRIDACVVGPGLMDEEATVVFTRALMQRFDCPTILDAQAMSVLTSGTKPRGPVTLTPHAGEMAHLTGRAKPEVVANAQALAVEYAARWQAGVVLKGACTCIAFPDEPSWRHDGGDVGLATSGSGDTLAGLIAGLAARGLSPLDAALWGVRLHALAGERLAARHGRLGFLARELSDEIPAAMHRLCTGEER
jgi:ADP-dependent NAD(P)H-hydrate dehydratase